MATQYTSLLGLALPVTGELSGSWGDVVNDSITSLLDSAVSGTTTLSADADVTLTDTDGVANQARQAILLWTATGTTTRNITAPAQSKAYFVINKTGGTQSIVIRGVDPTTGVVTVGVTVLAGTQALVVWNGVDFVEVASGNVDGPASATDSALVAFDGTTGKLIKQAATVTVAQGGTGATTLTANNVILGNGTSAVQVVAPGTNGNVLTSNGTTWQSSTPASQSYPGAGVAVSTGTAWATSLTAPSGTLVGTTDTQTLSNKRIDPRNVVAASAASVTPDVSVGDIYAFTALAAALAINAPIGTPTDGDKLIFRLLDNGTARALTWNATYTVIGVTLPTTTVINKTTYVGCIYNANNTRWDVIAVTTQA